LAHCRTTIWREHESNRAQLEIGKWITQLSERFFVEVDRVSGKQACQHDQTALSIQASCMRQQAYKAARAVVLIDLPNRHSMILKQASVVTIRLTSQSLRLQIADILPLRSHYSKIER
jgi:hypothetical protein